MASIFALAIDTGNDAFRDDEAGEVARILRAVADRLDGGQPFGALHDINGNRVGQFGLTPKET